MSGSSHLRFFRPFSGRPILVVHYPWQVHAHASIEVQWLPEGVPEPLNVRPLAFVDGYLKGELSVDADRCRRGAEKIATSTTRSKAGIKFDIYAKRNSLTNAAVWIHCHLPKAKDTTETRTAFVWLEDWALDGHTLYLDLPSDYYGKPGKLRFWMLRGKDTLWMETVAWPGLPSGTDDDMAAPGAKGAAKSDAAKGSPGDKTEGTAKPDADAKPKTAPPAKPAKKTAEEDDPFAAPEAKKKE